MDVPDAIQLMGDKQWQEIKSRLTGKFNKMMKGLFRQKGAQLDINILASNEAQDFITTHAGILDGGFQKVEMSDKMRERLTRSNYIFSGIKTFHELNEAFPSMLDENGNKKPFERFLNDVRKINDTYNANYLHAEYNFVQASATMAAKWEQFSEDGDRYNLQYRTAKDDKVRPEHAALDGVTLPMSDSFWETYYPPNGWNCFLPNTPVLTANGWKHIASIKKGDLVIGGSGEFREVTATLSRPFEGDLVTIITKGAKSTCTPNHRFCTRRGWVAAENLHKGDIIIQVGERSPLHLLVHAVGNTYTLLCYALMACIRKGKAVASLAVNHKPEFFNKEIYDVASNKLANLEWKAHCKEVASHDFFAFTQWQTQCAHPLWMKLASGKGIFDRILSYRWSKQRRGALQFVRYITNEAAIFLGLTLAHVKSFSCKFMVCLSKTFGCILSSFFRSNPLNADSCASMPDRDAQFAKNAMHSSSVHLPISNEPSEASLFCDVSEFCGIKDIHSFDGFHSFFDFLRNTFFHNRYVLVEGKVTKKNRNTKVFNLSIDKDESYIVPVGIAHNCRCTVVQVRKQKYPATEHAEAMSRGEEAMNDERYNIFRFNSGKQGKTMPDYNPYTIRRCNDCDVAKGKLKLSFVPENNLCASCIKTRECWARRQEDDPETFYECETRRGKVRVSSKHGKTEKKENVRVATYLAEKHEHEIDLIANTQNETSADSFNRTLGIEQEYKVNTTPTKSSIDNLIRKGAKQADDIVLFVDSEISLNDLSSALHDRVRRTNLKTVMIVIDEKDKTYTYDEITAKGFKIRQADLK